MSKNKVEENKVSKGKEVFLKKLKKLDGLSWFFIITTIAIIVSLSYAGYRLTVKADEAKKALNQYYDENLNFSVTIPDKWQAASPDGDHIFDVVRKVTGGILFDMRLHSLTEEVVPLALVENSQEKGKKYAKYMTLAFRGSDEKYSYLQDKIKLMDEFKKLLKKTGHTDIKVDEVKDVKDEEFFGILLKGSAKMKNRKIHYYQYYEPAGANILIITYGTTKDPEKGIDDIKEVLKTLVYYEGGEFLPTPFQEEMIKQSDKKAAEIDAKRKAIEEAQKKGSNGWTPTQEGQNKNSNSKDSNAKGNDGQSNSQQTIKLPTTPWEVPKDSTKESNNKSSEKSKENSKDEK